MSPRVQSLGAAGGCPSVQFGIDKGNGGDKLCASALCVIPALVAALADNDTWINYDPSGNMSKYEAINLTSLRSYGSVEFRMCPATLELDHTSGFLKILNSIAVLASRTSVEEMIGMIMQPEEEEVLVKLLNRIHFGDVFLSGDKQSLNNKVYGGSDLLARFCECRKQIAVRIRIGKA